MNQIEYSVVKKNFYPKASLSDSLITSVRFSGDGITFQFPNGIAVEGNEDATSENLSYFRTSEAEILINERTPDDIRCRILRRFSIFGKVFYLGRDIEPNQLALFMKDHQLELIDEFYAYQFLHWRCAVFSRKRGYTFSELELSIENVKEITYSWNEEHGRKGAFE